MRHAPGRLTVVAKPAGKARQHAARPLWACEYARAKELISVSDIGRVVGGFSACTSAVDPKPSLVNVGFAASEPRIILLDRSLTRPPQRVAHAALYIWRPLKLFQKLEGDLLLHSLGLFGRGIRDLDKNYYKRRALFYAERYDAPADYAVSVVAYARFRSLGITR